MKTHQIELSEFELNLIREALRDLSEKLSMKLNFRDDKKQITTKKIATERLLDNLKKEN